MQSETAGRWFRLDNAAKLYPTISKTARPSVYRLSVLLHETVDAPRLQTALERVCLRFPSFAVRLRRGLFWYYLEQQKGAPRVLTGAYAPCQYVHPRSNGGFLFRVLAQGRRISLEVFHSISDGTGALVFLRTLTAEYLRLGGAEIPCEKGVLDIHAQPDPAEWEDAYLRYANPQARPARHTQRAYHPPGRMEADGVVRVTNGTLSVAAVKQKSHALGVTVTEYLCAVLLEQLLQMQQMQGPRRLRPVRINVPVNLRTLFASRTLRNFTLFVTPGIDPTTGTYTLEQIARQVHHYMAYHLAPQMINADMSRNVASERNPVLRCLPLFIKKWGIRLVFDTAGDRVYSTTLTNLGPVEMPEAMRPYVQRWEAVLGANTHNTCNVAVTSTGDAMTVHFARTTQACIVERAFFTRLVRLGLHVQVDASN